MKNNLKVFSSTPSRSILDKYFDYLPIRSEAAWTIRVFDNLWVNADLNTQITQIIIWVITRKWPKFDFQYSKFASKMAEF